MNINNIDKKCLSIQSEKVRHFLALPLFRKLFGMAGAVCSLNCLQVYLLHDFSAKITQIKKKIDIELGKLIHFFPWTWLWFAIVTNFQLLTFNCAFLFDVVYFRTKFDCCSGDQNCCSFGLNKFNLDFSTWHIHILSNNRWIMK